MHDQVEFLDAVKSGQADIVRDLLQMPCSQLNLNAALCWAARLGHTDVLTLLLGHSADVHGETWGGLTPLIWAAMFSPNTAVIEILIQCGSELDHRSAKRRQSALHAAAINGRHEVVAILLSAGANPDVVDHLHKTPLLYAVQRNHPSCVRLLLQYNCNVNITGLVNGELMTPLISALIQSNLEMTKMLLLAGARFDKPAAYHTYSVTQFYQTVETNFTFKIRPVYLQQQCRVCLRQLLRPNFTEKLQTLLLPQPLKDFLTLPELDS